MQIKQELNKKKYYDIKARAAQLEVGDRVLVKILAHDGKHKLSDKWADEVYIVAEQPNADIPVYKVKREDGEGSTRTLHRNHLLYLGNKLQDSSILQNRPTKQPRGKDVPEEKSFHIPTAEKHSVSDDTKHVSVSDNSRPVPVPRKRRNHSKAASRTENVDREEEDEDMVVVTTTTTSNFADKNVDIVSTTEDSTAGSTATESIGTVEHTDLDEHGDAHEVDQDRVLETEDVFANTESHISVENEAENESLVSTDVEVVASTELNANGVDKFERAHITPEIATRRSTRVRKKPAWQQSGDYCMGISKQTMMLQSLLSSNAVLRLDSRIISAIVKGVSDIL